MSTRAPRSIFNNPEVRRSLLEPVRFAATLAAAALVHAATREPLIALIMPWLHGGWEPFRAGFWLLKADPVRSRARTCFAFYIAAGCWRAAAAALLAVVVLVYVAKATGAQPKMDEFAATMLALLGGLVLNMLIGLVATCAAVVTKVRVWVHPGLRRAIHDDLRLAAGLGPLRRGFNHAVFVVATALVFPLAVGGAAALAAVTVGKSRVEMATTESLRVGFAAMFGWVIVAVPCYAWLSSRIIARSPRECWPAETIDYSRSSMMAPTWRTPERRPKRCPACGNDVRIEPSSRTGDARCPDCGCPLSFDAK